MLEVCCINVITETGTSEIKREALSRNDLIDTVREVGEDKFTVKLCLSCYRSYEEDDAVTGAHINLLQNSLLNEKQLVCKDESDARVVEQLVMKMIFCACPT